MQRQATAGAWLVKLQNRLGVHLLTSPCLHPRGVVLHKAQMGQASLSHAELPVPAVSQSLTYTAYKSTLGILARRDDGSAASVAELKGEELLLSPLPRQVAHRSHTAHTAYYYCRASSCSHTDAACTTWHLQAQAKRASDSRGIQRQFNAIPYLAWMNTGAATQVRKDIWKDACMQV